VTLNNDFKVRRVVFHAQCAIYSRRRDVGKVATTHAALEKPCLRETRLDCAGFLRPHPMGDEVSGMLDFGC
jgi:hypothetical protein